jgi:DNA-binding MarR family transcriptional regulator
MKKRIHLIEEILNSFHAFRNMIRAKTASLGPQNQITHSQWFVLTVIGHIQKTSVKELSEILGMSSSAVTQFVNGLVQSGYVMRHQDPKDRRSAELKLSPKGKKYIAATKEKRIVEMAGIFDALTDRELEQYARLQKKIISRFSNRS